MKSNNFRSRSAKSVPASLMLAALLLQAASPAGAVVPELGSVPLGTFNPAPPRANLMFILDDSTSMERSYIPEATSGGPTYTAKCFGHWALNRIFFNPNTEYELPPQANFDDPVTTGSSTKVGKFPVPTDYKKVKVDGFSATSATVDLETAPPEWKSTGDNVSQGKFYYTTYTQTGTPTTCVQGNFTEVKTWSSLSAAQKRNYAIWYSFYRTRILMMRSAVGRVLAEIDASKFRVGYSTINTTTAVDGPGFHNIADFDKAPAASTKTTRTAILEKLYAAYIVPQTSGAAYTPLRPALVKAGRYYANKLDKQTDPVQYSCQRNYTMLTTDGYWNTAGETSNYKPKDINNADFTISTGDSGAAAPYKDAYGFTLADIAYYYYATDLRPEMVNNVPTLTTDSATHQRMNTYTLGLGVSGTLTFDPAYTDEGMKTKVWPDPLSSPTANTGNTVTTRIDDLWHAGVNGHGRYYSAADPEQVVQSLSAALKTIAAEVGTAAATTAASLTPQPGESQFFTPSYENKEGIPWRGDVKAYKATFDEKTGKMTLPTPGQTPQWSAQAKLDAATVADRKILVRTDATNALSDFAYAKLSKAQQAYFDDRCSATAPAASKLSQCASLSATALANVTGTNLVNYLRGDQTYGSSAFRRRVSVLGDIINSTPIYMGKPTYRYIDEGYSKYREVKADRLGVVYVGANDGMLHAFRADTGEELWAFIPSQVLPDLWRLADAKYDGNHRAFVDATPTLADVRINNEWRTVLISGLRGGGAAYFALDVTVPTAPKLLWEFTDKNLGFTFGNPVVTKLTAAGAWKVIFTSGYNNVADGHGRLYVRNIEDGSEHMTLSTAAQDGGSATSPSNLAKINAWVETDTNNVSTDIYGGDMLGNLWRFRLAEGLKDSERVVLLGRAKDKDGKIQPITTRPLLSEAPTGRMVAVGTGKYLSQGDLTPEPDTSPFSNQQSLYFVIDSAVTVGSLTEGMRKDGLSPLPVSATSRIKAPGAYIDLPGTGERSVVDGVPFDTLMTFPSTIPSASKDPCVGGGKSTIYYVDIIGSVQVTALDSLITGGQRILTPDETGGSVILSGPGGLVEKKVAGDAGSGGGGGGGGVTVQRSSWRELVD